MEESGFRSRLTPLRARVLAGLDQLLWILFGSIALVFVIACALAGMTGSLQGHYIKFVGPDAYSGFQSLNLVVMNVIGGMTSLAGALIGTVFMVTLPELLRGYVNLQQIMFGAILFATMAFLPGGIIEAIRRIRALLKPSKPGLAT